MRIPVSWLKEFVPVKAGADEIARRLTLSGFEVEEILEVDGEKVLEVNVTPNRGDCLSILGIAREIAAIYGRGVSGKPLSHRSLRPPRNIGGLRSLLVKVSQPKACPRYSLAVIEGVKIGSSPDWLVRRLAQVGIRSINNVVDVTNYVLVELGQPLHAFDRKKIRGGKILVRKARDQEKILTLDGEERELISDDLVIADSEGAIALAGIMGGKETEIDDNSTTAVLESAFFEPSGIRKTVRRLGIQTESSYRFERGIDPEGMIRALQRAAQLIQELAGGGMAGPLTDFYPGRSPGRKILFSPAQVETLLGGDWPVSRVKQNFGKLSLQVRPKTKERWEVSVPSYRSDIQREADLIEETARYEGLEKIPTTFPSLVAAPVSKSRASQAERTVRRLLADLGLREAVHFSFLSPEDLSHFDPSLLDRAVPLENPLGREYSLMRPTLLPSLLKTAALHHRHKISTVRLFELRNRFEKAEGRITESKTLAGVLTGHRLLSHWSDHVRETDFYDLKGLVERLFREMRILKSTFAASMAPFLHPNQQAAAMIGGRTVGLLGEVHPDLLSRFDLKRAAFVFELDWGALADLRSSEKQFESYSLHPVVERDLALVVEESVAAASLLEFIHGQDPAIWNVSLFDLYRGPQIPQGKKSLAFAIQIGRKNQTLTEEEVNAVYGRLVENLKQTFRAEVR